MVQRWEIAFEFDPHCITFIPLWITLPGLQVGYWSCEALSKIANGIGRPMHIDQFTACMERISYARVCVEVDVSQLLIESIRMATLVDTFHQSADYEWKPKFCGQCLRFGHNSEDCRAHHQEKEPEVDFNKVPRRKRRNRRRRRPIQHGWQVKAAEQQCKGLDRNKQNSITPAPRLNQDTFNFTVRQQGKPRTSKDDNKLSPLLNITNDGEILEDLGEAPNISLSSLLGM